MFDISFIFNNGNVNALTTFCKCNEAFKSSTLDYIYFYLASYIDEDGWKKAWQIKFKYGKSNNLSVWLIDRITRCEGGHWIDLVGTFVKII